jgi:TRAP-type C4-dicarboxylate transport system permease small subunit
MRWLQKASLALAGIGGVCTILMMLQIVADVSARWLTGKPIGGTVEIFSVYYLVALTFLPLATVQLDQRHIAVDLFIHHFSPRMQRLLAIFVALLSIACTALLTWYGLLDAMESLSIGEVIETAASVMIIWPSKFVLVLGIGAMILVLLVQLSGLIRRGAVDPSDAQEG